MAPDQPGSGRMSPFLLARVVQCERASRGTLRTACRYADRLEWLVVRVESVWVAGAQNHLPPLPSPKVEFKRPVTLLLVGGMVEPFLPSCHERVVASEDAFAARREARGMSS